MTTKALKKQLAAAIAMVLVAGVALSSSTYAWFVSNTKVTADSVSVTAKTANTLLIAETGTTNWTTVLSMTDTAPEMVPVSTIGSSGLLTFVKDSNWTHDDSNNQDYASAFKPAIENTDYWTHTFDIKSSVAGTTLYLDTETVWEMATYDDDNDPETPEVPYDEDVLSTLRLGLVVSAANYTKTFIYQFETEALDTAYDTSIDYLTTVDGINKAINASGQAADMVVDNADSSLEMHLATAPSDGNTFVETVNGADALYEFENADDVVTVTAYIWMEGCDHDTNSAMVSTITGQTVKTVLGFAVANE